VAWQEHRNFLIILVIRLRGRVTDGGGEVRKKELA